MREQGRVQARYRYNHRGERVSKAVAESPPIHYLHEGRRLAAELNSDGKVVRQYIHLADLPIAVIDTPQGAELVNTERSAWAQIVADVVAIGKAWFGPAQAVAYLHHNHLGAPELATDAGGEPIWQARYGAFGRLTEARTPSRSRRGSAKDRRSRSTCACRASTRMRRPGCTTTITATTTRVAVST